MFRIFGTFREVPVTEVVFVFFSIALLAQPFSMLLDIREALVTAIFNTKVRLDLAFVTAAVIVEKLIVEADLAKFLIRELFE